MRLGLEGKTVVITGGAGGIGKEAARGFLKEGAAVAVFARTEEKVDDFCREMRGLGYDNFYGEVLEKLTNSILLFFIQKVEIIHNIFQILQIGKEFICIYKIFVYIVKVADK